MKRAIWCWRLQRSTISPDRPNPARLSYRRRRAEDDTRLRGRGRNHVISFDIAQNTFCIQSAFRRLFVLEIQIHIPALMQERSYAVADLGKLRGGVSRFAQSEIHERSR